MKNVIAKKALSTPIAAFGPAIILTVIYFFITGFRFGDPDMGLHLFAILEPILLGLIVLMALSALFTALPTFFKPNVLVESSHDQIHIHGTFQKTHVVHRESIEDIDYRYFTHAGRGQANISRHGVLIIYTQDQKHVIRHVAYVDKAYERLRDLIKG